MGALLGLVLFLFQDSLSEARARLAAIEAERQQMAAIAAQVAEKQAEQVAAAAVQEEAEFQEVEEVVPVEPVITFETAQKSSGGLLRSESVVRENWLVTTANCRYCPAAKTEFLKAGNPKEHMISPEQAFELHGQVVKSVPFEYSVDVVTVKIQPPSYRFAKKMEWALDKDHKPSKATILKHLRDGKPHQEKHWQQWNLEVWNVEQLWALHDDDHNDVVPTFEEESLVVATVENSRGVTDVFAALAAHLIESSNQKGETEYAYGSFFDFELDVPDSVRDAVAKVLTVQKMEIPSAGLTVDWAGVSRSIVLGKEKIEIDPPVKVTVKKWVISYSASLRGVWFEPDLSSVTFDLQGAPDLKVILK